MQKEKVKRNYSDSYNAYDASDCNNLLRLPNLGNVGYSNYLRENPTATIVPTDKLDFDLELVNLLYSIDYDIEDEKVLAAFIFRYAIFEKAIQFYINHSHIGQTINISISKIYNTYKYYLSLCFSEFVNIIYEDDYNEGYFLEKICYQIANSFEAVKTSNYSYFIKEEEEIHLDEDYQFDFYQLVNFYFAKNNILITKQPIYDKLRKDINLNVFVGFSWHKEVNLLPKDWASLSLDDLIKTILIFGHLKHC